MDTARIRSRIAKLATGIGSFLLLVGIGPKALLADSNWQPFPGGEIRRIARRSTDEGLSSEGSEPGACWREVARLADAPPGQFQF